MTENEKQPLSYLMTDGKKIRDLILSNPDLPLVFMATDDANAGDYWKQVCCSIHAEIGEVLDCNQTINDEIIFCDREEFTDYIFDRIDEFVDRDDMPLSWYEAEARRIAAEYDPCWKKCIIITVGN